MPRLLLLLPTSTYRAEEFLTAALRLGVEVVAASELPSTLQSHSPEHLLHLDLSRPSAAAAQARSIHQTRPFDAVVGVDDGSVAAAAGIAAELGLHHNSPESVRIARSKPDTRRVLAASGLNQPPWKVLPRNALPPSGDPGVEFPCVVKPLGLSGSRGVIRADNPSELGAAYSRLASLLAAIESEGSGAPGADLSRIIVERYIPGTEVAVEGILNDGALQVICIFDKPDPLEGPYFEESIYTTPSRLPEEWKSELRRTVQRAVSAIGLRWGPVHAEARLNDQGVWILEINPRTIGGKCARMFRLGSGMALEEMVLRQALDMPLDADLSPRESLGVLMLGVPEHGLLEGVRGLEEARNVVGVQEVTMTAHAGQLLTPLPEGGAYPGFVIATGDTPAQVEETLREAGRLLQLKMRSVGPVTGPSRS